MSLLHLTKAMPGLFARLHSLAPTAASYGWAHDPKTHTFTITCLCGRWVSHRTQYHEAVRSTYFIDPIYTATHALVLETDIEKTHPESCRPSARKLREEVAMLRQYQFEDVFWRVALEALFP